MNKTKLKSYAPQARKDFIAAVTARAHLLGLSEKAGKLEVAISLPQGDATVIAGHAWPVKVHSQRQQLITRIQRDGFAQTMEAVAYTWFNRFAALRYMELHDYLGHGHRALSSLDGSLPDILSHAADLAQDGVENGGLPGLKPALVVEMKLAGNRDGELYSMLLVAQCNALSNAMPFLFERIDDETELLLPDNLLRTDSVIAKLVASIEEEDWKEVEIIGWLYQFYISEKKDEVIGKVVKSEDIPAATQLFTPNWIVQYMVQNSIGRLWLMANPASTLQVQWPYYISPTDQSPEAQTQLDALIQARTGEDGGSLNPETITMLDPACGSGHILVEAYEVFKAIYLERGYQPRSIPRLILEKNLYGLDIDDRAAQMAGFALLMKARADDRRLFSEPVRLNVLSLQESKGLDAVKLARALQSDTGSAFPQIVASVSPGGFADDDLFPGTRPHLGVVEPRGECMAYDSPGVSVRPVIAALIATFEHAKTFGSLIQIPPALNAQLAEMTECLQTALSSGDLYAEAAAQDLLPLVVQARMLGMQFDAVVANPPYMGSNLMNTLVKRYAADNFPDAKSDLFACFILRGCTFAKQCGFSSMITMDGWMFLSSYASLRDSLLRDYSIDSLVHIGWNCFPEVHTYHRGAAFVLFNGLNEDRGRYLNLSNVPATVDKGALFLSRLSTTEQIYYRAGEDFLAIPGSPLAYWVSEATQQVFKKLPRAASVVCPREGLATGNNDRYVRMWWEVSLTSIGFNYESRIEAKLSKKRWFPYNKGGDYRKWFGNNLFVVDWLNDGLELQTTVHPSGKRIWAHNFNLEYIFRPFVTWSDVTSKGLTLRLFPSGYLFDATGLSAFSLRDEGTRPLNLMAALGNSILGSKFSQILNPTLHFKSGNFADLPVDSSIDVSAAERCIELARMDWNAYERSWEFETHPLLSISVDTKNTLKRSYFSWVDQNQVAIAEMQRLEQENNRLFIDGYSLANELIPDVSLDEITLTTNPSFRYGGKFTEDDQWNRFLCETMEEMLSYAIGCMMGRYRLDEPGLIYANAGNVGFDAANHNKFPADADGIVPLNDEIWFEDEAASRIREFLLAIWGADTLVENMAWLAESLGTKAGETPDETIRRYLAEKFYKDHLQTYKKRPIYWLFSSGKQGAFQALVYMHRYHEGTLARMRAEYVVPLTGKIQSRIDMLEKDATAAVSTAARNKLAKEVERLKKKHVELLAYDEQLRHHADMRITLDLDDGVKVNYGKFGNLLAEVRAVTGGAGDD